MKRYSVMVEVQVYAESPEVAESIVDGLMDAVEHHEAVACALLSGEETVEAQ